MKKKDIVAVLSIGVIIGFLAGFFIIFEQLKVAFDYIIAHQYIKYKMYRPIALLFQESIIKWMIITTIISLTILIVWLLGRLFISNIVNIDVKDKNKIRVRFSITLSSLFFFLSLWTINYYCLHNKLHVISLGVDFLILLLTIILGWVLIKVKLEKIAKAIIVIFSISYIFC